MPGIIHEIKNKVRSRHDEILGFLKEIVQTDSTSRNYEGVNRVGEMILEKLPPRMKHSFHADRNGVRHHIFETGADKPGSNLLLVGHIDTVFPPEKDKHSLMAEGPVLRGAGVTDMKAGVIVIVYALRILDALGLLEEVPARCLLNGDEEIGSPHSRPLIKKLAHHADYGLIFEDAGPRGEVVFAQRGVRRFKLAVTGQARHAGMWEGKKTSAILEISRMVQKLEGLNENPEQVTLNVGTITGGTGANVVPDRAGAVFEYRFWDEESELKTLERINSIVDNPGDKGCSARVRCFQRRPAGCPVPGSSELYRMLKNSARELGQRLDKIRRGSTSDLNILLSGGTPAVDGMGPVGGLDHSREEFIVVDSLFERIELTILFLARLVGSARL